MYNIELEDLVANIFFKYFNKKTFFSYIEIEKYGYNVINKLKDNNKNGKLILSREKTNNFLLYCDSYFTEKKENNTIGIQLKSNINEDDLIKNFRGYLPLDLLRALIQADI